MNYTYSIIIPHYNIPLLLKRCLLSIPKRNDVQIIVVDDCSSESFILELNNIKRLFPYVEFYTSECNKGGGHARNIGLKYAKGKFLLFADADDSFNYCLNQILDDYCNSDVDIVFFNSSCLDTETYCNVTKRQPMVNLIFELYKINPKAAIEKFKYIAGEPWAKLVNKKIVIENNIVFDETRIHNDTYFSYMVGYLSKNIIVDNRAIYCLFDRQNSVSKSISKEKIKTRVEVFAKKSRFLKSKGINIFEDEFICSSIFSCLKDREFVLVKELFEILNRNHFSNYFIVFRMFIFLTKRILNYKC